MIQYNHHALVHTLWQRNAEENANLLAKNTASSSKQYYFLEYPFHFFKRSSRQKKKKKIGGKNWTSYYDVPLYLVYVSRSRTLWTTTNKLEAGPPAKGRDNEGKMRRSYVCFFGLVATCDVRTRTTYHICAEFPSHP